MSHTVTAIPALNDNYIWLVVHNRSKKTVIIDPGESLPILSIVKKLSLTPVAILITHHHWDHTNGITEIVAQYNIPVFGPANDSVKPCNYLLKEDDKVKLPDLELELSVLDVPGHTIGHVVYHSPIHRWIFTGDTLFTGGCGRLFEGRIEQLYYSLEKLAALDPRTKIYCGHEYTLKNLYFALTVEPNNLDIKRRLADVKARLAKKLPTVPSTIALEKLTNPFLRCEENSIRESVKKIHYKKTLNNPIAVLEALRVWKDQF